MSFPFLYCRRRVFRRIVGVAALLLLFSGVEICSAAEATFGGNYCLQLPPRWTAKAGKDNAIVGETNGVNFTANAFPTKQSAEEVMENAIRVAEKRAGYKFIEKGSVKTGGGRTAQVFRFNVDGETTPFMGVNYYFKMDKDVVVLVFAISSGVPKSIKNEIEAMVDSVKVAAGTAKEDSWLSSDAPAAGTPKTSTAPSAPVAPKTAGTSVTFATNCSVVLPAGWTGKAAGTHLQATGPGDTTLDGFAMKGASVEDAIAGLTTMIEKTFTGYQLLETVDVSTEAGAKGKLLHYQYDGKGGTTTRGFCAIIKASENQIVSLRFASPNATKKLDPVLWDGVRAIYRSLQVTQ